MARARRCVDGIGAREPIEDAAVGRVECGVADGEREVARRGDDIVHGEAAGGGVPVDGRPVGTTDKAGNPVADSSAPTVDPHAIDPVASALNQPAVFTLQIAVDPTNGDVYATMLYDDPSDSESDTFPKVTRFTSTNGGITAVDTKAGEAGTQGTDILKMPGEEMRQSHIISNLTFGPDNKLWVHVGEGFEAGAARDVDGRL